MSTITTTPGAAAAAPANVGERRVVRPAAFVALAYLTVSFPALFLVPQIPWGTVAAHVAAMLGLGWATRLRPNVLADWLPLLLTVFFYVELPALIHGVSHPELHGYRDHLVQAWEQGLFGTQPAHRLAGAIPWLWLSESVHAGYLAYYFLIFGPPLVLYLRGRRKQFATAQLAILTTFVVCYVVFIVFPVEGPRYAWPSPPGVPDGPVRRFALWLLEGGSSRGTAFPSSHAAVAVAASVGALRYQPKLGLGVAATTVLLVVGAVYGGFHYGIDMAVGVAVGLVVSLAVIRWRDRSV